MSRLAAFKALSNHPWFGRIYAKLTAPALIMALAFLEDNKDLSGDDFAFKVNRMFLDQPNKPKGWQIIMDLLTAACIADTMARKFEEKKQI